MMRIFTLIAFCTALSTAAVQFQLIFSSMPGKKGAKPTRTRTALDLRGTHHVSQRALTHICKNIKLKGMVNAISPRTQRRNRSALANRVTPFGKLIQERNLVTKKGGKIRIPFLHPAAMLWICCEDRNEFKTFFSSVLEKQPRLRLVQYTDEVTPGRELLAYNEKRSGSCIGHF